MKIEISTAKSLAVITLIFFLCCPWNTSAQTTVTLYPDIDAAIVNALAYPEKADNNYGAYTVNRAWAWSWSSQNYYWRTLMKFDLSSIPVWANVTSAQLTMYGTNHNPLTNSNACYLERVTSDWSEMGVTWNTQPTVTSTGKISLAQSTSSTQNYTIDVTSFVNGWIGGDYSNYGLRMKLQVENKYASMEFASSDHTDSNKHPKLVITYTMTTDADKNYVKKYNPNIEESSVANVEVSNKTGSRKSKSYVDGFGRIIQGLNIEASPLGKDIIQPVADYDAMGRPTKNYLPFAMITANGGNFVSDATLSSRWTAHYGSQEDDYAFSETLYEASPLGRPVKQGATGSAWELSDATAVEYDYSSNSSAEVLLWTIDGSGNVKTGSQVYYNANTLSKSKITDPDDNISITYKNKSGQTILTKVQASSGPTETSHSGWACTYSVYDKYGRLRRILTPELVDAIYGSVTANYTISSTDMNNRAFQQEYDNRDRITREKAPGAGWNYYVYDNRDRLVLTQDAKQRQSDKWSFIKYDQQNRPVLSGIYIDTRDLTAMQSYVYSNVNGSTFAWEEQKGTARHEYTNAAFPTTPAADDYLKATYYDDYKFGYAQSNGFTNKLGYSSTDKTDAVTGMATGSKVRKLGDGVSGWMSSVSYYDKNGQTIQGKGENHLSGYDLITTEYNFTGAVTKTEHVHYTTIATVTETEEFTYDHIGRMKTHTHQTGSQTAVTLTDLDYDELGRMKTENIGNSVESIDYEYNIRGWPTKNGTRNSDVFGMDIKYNTGITTGVPAQYGGNIAEIVWQHESYVAHKYGYEYDWMSRLAKAKYGTTGYYDVTGNNNGKIGYDLNGNIESLKRKKSGTLIDNLTYTYASGRLTKVEDATSNAAGFNNGNASGADYEYYDNGLLKYDKNKNIVQNIVYNEINLPKTIIFTNNYKIRFTYAANGAKLRMVVENGSGTPVSTIDYVGVMIYVDGTLEQLQTAGGRVLDPATSNPDYEFYVTDHLGSVRAVVDETGAVKQIRDYYPFGMEMITTLTASPENRYGYQGKEWLEEEGLEWQDFHARMYDPATGRFLAVDPQGQFASPYMGMGNNPVMMVDPDGEWVNLVIGGVIGGVTGYISGRAAGLRGTELAAFTVGMAVVGAISSGVGVSVSTSVSSAVGGGIGGGIVSGAAGGAAGGFVAGAGGAMLTGGNVLESGLKGAGIGGLTGGLEGDYRI